MRRGKRVRIGEKETEKRGWKMGRKEERTQESAQYTQGAARELGRTKSGARDREKGKELEAVEEMGRGGEGTVIVVEGKSR